MQEQATSSLPSSSERSSSSAAHQVKEGAESDDEIRRVPDFGGELLAGPSTSGQEVSSAGVGDRIQAASAEAGQQRKRGRDPADKEHKRLKRLLRNRVSAQQARERKKAYLNDLEVKVKELEKRNSELEERLSTLQNENQMLRQGSHSEPYGAAERVGHFALRRRAAARWGPGTSWPAARWFARQAASARWGYPTAGGGEAGGSTAGEMRMEMEMIRESKEEAGVVAAEADEHRD